jgi:hypothetical protein
MNGAGVLHVSQKEPIHPYSDAATNPPSVGNDSSQVGEQAGARWTFYAESKQASMYQQELFLPFPYLTKQL